MIRVFFLLAAGLASALVHAAGTEVLACVVAPLEKNPTYFGTATTVTKLKCEITNEDVYPTLPDLYRQGWRLIQVLGAEQAIASQGKGTSPLYLLEHESTAAAAESRREAPASKKGR